MTVSIIIPSYNRADIIMETLVSIQNQTYQNWEVLVVDDHSQDSTQQVVKEFIKLESRINFFERPNELKKGANSCRNFGFLQAKGKYIKFLDSDDLLTPDTLQQQVKILESNKDLQVCLSYGRFFNNETNVLEEFWSRNKQYPDILYGYIKNKIRWAISDPLWRKSFFSEPPFREGLMNSQEWLMHGQALIRLEENQIYNLKESFSRIRRGNKRMSSSRSSNYYKNQKLARYYLFKTVLTNKRVNSKIYFELLKQILIFYYWEYHQKYRSSNT